MKRLMILCFILGALLAPICMAQNTDERLAGVEGALKQIDKRLDELRRDMNVHLGSMDKRLTILESRQDSFVTPRLLIVCPSAQISMADTAMSRRLMM